MFDISPIVQQISELDRLVDQFYRHDPVKESNTVIREAIDQFNSWQDQEKKALEKKKSSIEDKLLTLRHLEKQIADYDHRLAVLPDARDSDDATARYNQSVTERNVLVEKHTGLARQYEKNLASYNEAVTEFNKEAKRQKENIDRLKEHSKGEIQNHKRWEEDDGAERLAHDLNKVYATLHRETRKSGDKNEAVMSALGRVRSIRKEIAAYVKKSEEREEHGLLLVEARLCGKEDCMVLVDIAASFCSISQEMVDVLDIGQYVGDEIRLSLPNAIRIKACRLLIPSISLLGFEAEFVKGVVLKEGIPGVDGCLGLSFLNRFDYSIERTRSPKLLLRAREVPESHLLFDVFISHRSHDYATAREIFDLLTRAGYRPFLSEESIPAVGTTDYQRTIDSALEGARHLALVCSSPESVCSSWVQAEWRMFEGLIRSGKKRGNILPVLCGTMKRDDLPLAIRRYQSIMVNEPKWQELLIRFIPQK